MSPCAFPKNNMPRVRREDKELVHVTWNAMSIRYLQMCVASSTMGVFRKRRSNFKDISDVLQACAHKQIRDSGSQAQSVEGQSRNMPTVDSHN